MPISSKRCLVPTISSAASHAADPSIEVDDRCTVVDLFVFCRYHGACHFNRRAARLRRLVSFINDPSANAYNCIGPCASRLFEYIVP